MTISMYLQPSTSRAAKKFGRDADKYARKATKSRASARKALIKIGIYNKDGSLAKKYK